MPKADGDAIGKARPLVSMPPALGYAFGRLLGAFLGDVIITINEIEGLMAGFLCVPSPPAGHTRLSEWASSHSSTLGLRYSSELARRRDRRRDYRLPER